MNSSTARLRLLGAPVLSDADGTPVAGGAAQPHRIALLALLALHPNRTATRAELTAHLWPGHDPREANQLLNKEVFSINKALGDDAIFSNAREVRLGSRVTVDALDFQAALDEGRPGDAISVYAGPLLDGFGLDDAPEFQSWAARQRARFATARKTLRPLAEAVIEVQHDLSEPEPDVDRPPPEPPPEPVREAAKPPADAKRKRPRRPRTPPVVPAAQESPPEMPPDAQEAPPEVTPPSPTPASGVFWAPEPSPVVGHAAQQTTPQEPRASDERPADVPAEPAPTPDFVIERTAPPVNFAPPPEPPARIDPDAAEAAARETAAREAAAREAAAREAEAREAAERETARREAAERETARREAEEREAAERAAAEREAARLAAAERAAAEHTTGTPADDTAVVMWEPASDVASPDSPPAPAASPPDRAPSRAPRRRRPIPRPPAKLVVTVLVLALLGGIGYVARGRILDAGAKARSVAGQIADAGARARSAAGRIVDARTRARAIAVLPIELTSSDPADDALAAGIGEELVRMLTRSGLPVAPGDMFAYRTPPYDIRAVADTLGVTYVLQGAMRKDGDTVRFRFQLVSAADGVTRWVQDYAPKLADILALQDDVAATVAKEILEGPATAIGLRETENAAAYLLVLRGRERAMVRSDSAARQGLEYFRQAVALDSSYARAWAGLARMYVRTTATLPAAGRDRQLALASQAAQRAVALDDSLAEAHAAFGLARAAQFDMAGAETHLQRALELDPTRAAHESLVNLYSWTGRLDEALAIAQRALEGDTLSPYAHADVARVLYAMNRCDEALTHLDRVAAASRPARAGEVRALCRAQKGLANEAIAAARSAITARDSSSVSLLAFLLQRAGNSAGVAPLRGVVMDRLRRGRAGALDLALLDAGEKNLDAAARRVQEAVDARSFLLAPGVEFVVLTGPLFQELQRQPGFLDARKRLGYR